jgi:hypothetical protein
VDGGARAAVPPPATAVVSEPTMCQARAVSTTRPSCESDADSSSTERPGRSTEVDTVRSATGTGPSTSNVTRAKVGRWAVSARTSNADGGPRCWLSGPHGPTVCDVERNTSSPRGR